VLVALLITGLVVALLLREVGGLEASKDSLLAARWELVPLPLLLMGLILLLCVQKWRVVLRAMDYEISLGRGVYALLASMPVAAITPSRAGDFLRAKVIEDQVPVLRGLGSVLCDRLVDIHNLALLACVGALVTGNLILAGALGAGLALAWVLLLGLIRQRELLLERWPLVRAKALLHELLEATVAMFARPRLLAAQFALSLANWITVLSVLFSLGLVFDAGLSWSEVLSLWPLATLFGLIPLTLSGMGTRDAAFVYLVGTYGHASPDENAIVLATLVYAFISSWMWGVIGLPFTLRWLTRAPEREANAHSGS
jgi:uncharacterized protein (TIRG00374 family)